MQAERIRFSGLAPIPRLSLFPRFQRFICIGKYFREFQMPRNQRFPDSRGYTVVNLGIDLKRMCNRFELTRKEFVLLTTESRGVEGPQRSSLVLTPLELLGNKAILY